MSARQISENHLQRHGFKENEGSVTHSFLYNGRMVKISCEVRSRIDESLRAGHFYEHRMLGHITRESKAGTFIDVGGNCGQHTVYFALFAPSIKVLTFEPFPEHCKLILQNIADNALESKVTLHPIGLSDRLNTFEIKTNSAIHQRRYNAPCMALDNLVNEPVSVLKIDVEGMELDVLRGATRILHTYKPAVYLEAHTPEHQAEIQAFLVKIGYQQTDTRFNASPTWLFVPDRT